MARTNLTLNTFSTNAIATVAPTEINEVDGAMFLNSGEIILLVENTSVAPADITFITGLVVEGFTVQDFTETITNGERRWCSRFTTTTFNQTGGDAGYVYVDVTDAMDVTAFSLA